MPRIKNQFKVIHTRSDARGNMLLVDEEPVYGTRRVFLHLKGEDHKRLIGQIDRQNRIIFMKRDKTRHFFHKMQSWGFNYTVIKDTMQFDNVLLQVSEGEMIEHFMVPRKFILDNGVVKEFAKTGFEIQIMLRVEYLEKFKTSYRFEPSKLLST